MKPAIATLLMLVVALAAAPAHAGLAEDLMALDKTQWDAWPKKDGDTFRKYLTEDAVQVVAGVGMTAGREAIAKAVESLSCTLESADFQNVTARQLSSDVAILSYTANQDVTCDGSKLPPRIQVTSIYVKQKGKWLQTSYQETPID